MNLNGLVGNERVKSALRLSFDSGRFPHAITLQGEQGCGKKTLSNILAAALVCRSKVSPPCGECPACIRVQAGSHPDIRIEQGSGVSHSISTESVKAIGEYVSKSPLESQCRVVLLHIKNTISEAAQNKLLKLIEEPVANVYYIITIVSAARLLPTIRSRVQCFTLMPPEEEQAARYFAHRTSKDYTQALSLARKVRGNIGAMLLGDETGAEGSLEIARRLVQALMAPGEHELLACSACLIDDKEKFRQTMEDLTVIFRDAYAGRLGAKKILDAGKEESSILETLALKRLLKLPYISQEYKNKVDTHVNMGLLVTTLCAELRQAAGK